MSTERPPTTMADLRLAAQARPEDRALQLLRSEVRDFHRLGKELVEQAEWIKDRMDQVVRRVNQGSAVNSLGELQSLATNLDRLCALRQAQEELVKALAWTLDIDPSALLAPGGAE